MKQTNSPPETPQSSNATQSSTQRWTCVWFIVGVLCLVVLFYITWQNWSVSNDGQTKMGLFYATNCVTGTDNITSICSSVPIWVHYSKKTMEACWMTSTVLWSLGLLPGSAILFYIGSIECITKHACNKSLLNAVPCMSRLFFTCLCLMCLASIVWAAGGCLPESQLRAEWYVAFIFPIVLSVPVIYYAFIKVKCCQGRIIQHNASTLRRRTRKLSISIMI